jgi:hypothetical protein
MKCILTNMLYKAKIFLSRNLEQFRKQDGYFLRSETIILLI